MITQTEPMWSKYKPVYNGYWLQKYADKKSCLGWQLFQ